MPHRAVFLDRDGVLTDSQVIDGKAYAPRRLEDFRLLPDAAESVAALHAEGWRVVVVTNQPDVGHGLIAQDVLDEMHRRLVAATGVDAVFTCPHRQDEGCACRKPKAGLLLDAARVHDLALGASWMVGDRASDVEAGRRAGCRTVFIDRSYAEPAPHTQDATVSSLGAAVAYISTQPRMNPDS